MKYFFFFVLLMAGMVRGWSQDTPAPEIPKIYPANWWVGMKNPSLQLMIHGKNIGRSPDVRISYPGIRLQKIIRTKNPNYLFLDLVIGGEARPGVAKIRAGGETISFPLNARRAGNGARFAQGVTSSDFIYFLMPDRWSNGDPGNDRVPGMRDQSLDRDSIYFRHGGDLQGVINHLDYLQGLGVTTLWMTPVLENDMPDRTEHGYAFTDHYTIEPRLGGAAAYRALSDSLHRRGMKLIQDAVYNHVGSFHFLVQDAPAPDWLHQWPVFTQTNYRDATLMDPHGSAIDKKTLSNGWFTTQMPDLNQGNPLVTNFLIQHALWCVEAFGVDGWRIDTYIYCDPVFMNRCNQALTEEYPHITLFGEAWVHGVANQAYFVDNRIETPFKSNLQGAVDFQCLFSGIQPSLTEDPDSAEGVNKLYNTLSNDFLYKDPMRNVIFLDNHDMSRFFSVMGEDVAKQKMGIAWLLTERGIPQLYYGTEILMKGFSKPDGLVRLDFPGGWKGDSKNAFTGAGLSADELAVQKLVRTLANWRKHSSAIKTGKMEQFVPQKGLYVYFRYNETETVMCIMNTSSHPIPVDFDRYSERTAGYPIAQDEVTGDRYDLSKPATIPAMTMWVLELIKSKKL